MPERPTDQFNEKLTSPLNSPFPNSEDICQENCRVVCLDEAIFSLDAEGLLNSLNPRAQELLGYSVAEILGKPFRELLPEGEEEMQRISTALKDRQGVYHFETLLRGKESREIPVKLSVSVVPSNHGQREGMVILCHDLSRIRELETVIREKEQFFASILRNSVDAIFTLDSQERITTWNKGAEAIFGYSEEEMLGQSLDILLPPHLSERKELEQISRISRNEGFLRSYQTQRLTKDRQLIDVIFTRTAIKDPEGKLIGFSSVLKDVTEQKLMDRHLSQMEKLSAIGELTAGLAHEIKNPLAGIKGAIEIICDSLPEDHPHRAILVEVLSEVRRIDRSVMNLLSFSKPGNPDFVRTDLVELFKEILSFLKKLADSKKISLRLKHLGSIPFLIGDENELKQLFMNLILNSIEAIETNGVVTVKVKSLGDSKIQVEVADDGPGIPKDKLGKIFHPFFTTKKHGTGLGLATCKRIVLNHGGQIMVESEPDKGARFIIELPLIPVFHPSLSR